MKTKGNKVIMNISIDRDIFLFIKKNSIKISPIINDFLKEYVQKFNSVSYNEIKNAVMDAMEEKEKKALESAIEKTKEVYEVTGEIPANRYSFLYEKFGLTKEEVDKLVINKIVRGR